MRQIAEFIAVLTSALFTGAAVYITFVEHPARMQCGVELAATEFAPSYRRATVMQATCAAVGLLSSVAAWLAGATFLWLVGGIMLVEWERSEAGSGTAAPLEREDNFGHLRKGHDFGQA